ncbi:MAG: 2Fe-2S iron-sulfur cluster binding domain-containing protein [Dehalococcoidia bacterium]|nr:MAG: 2Fe-2S iron-sulfur cluster binding domain-containing protein [Dehalococcoidia bacterium]
MKKVKKVTLTINDREVRAEGGMTILEAARDAGIHIPTLCYHEKLAPYGACRLCTVEISQNGRTQLVTACVYPAEDGLVVKTDSQRVIRIRKMLLELMLASSPAKTIQDLAQQHGVAKPRFEAEKTNCILCGLCVRYCNEIKKANAIGFVGRGTERRVVFYPEIASTVCASCRECFSLCPTGKLPSETDGVCFDDLTLEDFLGARQARV